MTARRRRRPGRTPAAAALLVLGCTGALAHQVPGLAPHNLAAAWSTQAWLWLLWLAPGLLVLRGFATLWRQPGPGQALRRRQALAFTAGWLVLGGSVLSPLDALGEALFWVHMVQHEVMMLVAAPLLVLGRPLGALAWGLPPPWRPGAALLARRLGLQAAMRWSTQPVVAWTLHAVALWAWHAPLLFQLATRKQAVHDLQHISFFVSALVFWWALFQRGRGPERHGVALFYMFTTLLHTSVLGALLTFSGRVWYPVYEATAPHWGWTALEDQQLGGLIMWVPGGMVYFAGALLLFMAWLRDAERRSGWISEG